jgi:hypothetical protein
VLTNLGGKVVVGGQGWQLKSAFDRGSSRGQRSTLISIDEGVIAFSKPSRVTVAARVAECKT